MSLQTLEFCRPFTPVGNEILLLNRYFSSTHTWVCIPRIPFSYFALHSGNIYRLQGYLQCAQGWSTHALDSRVTFESSRVTDCGFPHDHCLESDGLARMYSRLRIFHEASGVIRFIPFELDEERSASSEFPLPPSAPLLPSFQLFPIATPMGYHSRLLSSNNLFTHEPEEIAGQGGKSERN